MPPSPLAASLEALLPEELNLNLYHLSHAPIRTPSLYTALPGRAPLPTTLESHFLAVSHEGTLFFAIEVLIYITTRPAPSASGKSVKETTFFISKADSSGWLPRTFTSFRPKQTIYGIVPNRQSTLRILTTTFISHLFSLHHTVHPQNTKSTISLFARAQNQYLFPNSVQNKQKHVLDDRGLIRWWTRVLDPILQRYSVSGGGDAVDTASAHLLVPGLDKYETASLFPPTTRQPEIYKDALRWTYGHPLKTDPAQGFTVREVIPHFPDDPKARFLDDLNSDGKQEEGGGGGGGGGKKKLGLRTKKKKDVPAAAGSGSGSAAVGSGWKNVQTLEQFWELMSFRQECSMGRCVGFIWVTVERKNVAGDVGSGDDLAGMTTPKDSPPTTSPPPMQSTQSTTPPPMQSTQSTQTSSSPKLPRYSLTLPVKLYTKVTESLLQTDFGKAPYARSHSKQWVEGAASLSPPEAITKFREERGISADTNGNVNNNDNDSWDWGERVVGTISVEKEEGGVSGNNGVDTANTTNTTCTSSGEKVNIINVLTVRKKKRASPEPVVNQATGTSMNGSANVNGSVNGNGNTVNVLSGGMIRKKPKLNKDASDLSTLPSESVPAPASNTTVATPMA